MNLPPVRHTRCDDDASVYDLCRTPSAAKDPREDDDDKTRAARFTKRVQDGESKIRLTALRRNPKPPTKIDHESVRRMDWAGLNSRQIGDVWGVRTVTIRRILRRYEGHAFRKGPGDG